jgi:hypothetical protein
MRQTRLFAIAALALITAATAACGRKQVETTAGGAVRADSTSIVVDNQALYDMTIYVLEGSTRRRLGTANSVSTTRLDIPRVVVGNGRDLQFLADPFAGRGNSVSQRIHVRPGDQVSMTIIR